MVSGKLTRVETPNGYFEKTLSVDILNRFLHVTPRFPRPRACAMTSTLSLSKVSKAATTKT